MEITQTEKLNYLSVNVQAAIKEQTSFFNEKKQQNDQNQSLSNVQQKISVQNQPKLSSSSKFNQQTQSTSNETQDISKIKANQVNQMVEKIQRNHQTSQQSKKDQGSKFEKKLSGAISLTLTQQSNTEISIKKFQLQLSNYSFVFELMNDKFIVQGETQNGRECMKQIFSYQNFTEQMKALFQSTEEIWTILYSDKQSIELQDFKLFFKIYLGGKEKKINIPLKKVEFSDKEYIEKLQKTVLKYFQLTKQLQNELNRQKIQCTCKNQSEIKKMNPLANGKVKSGLSRASSTWPQFENGHQVYQGQTEDHLVLFEEMIQKMSKMRDEFSDLAQQIEQKILNGSGIKVIRIKFLVLEKKKKDCSKVLGQYSQKFASFQCKSDIQVQIDQLQSFMNEKYETIKNKITPMKDAN